MSKFCINCGAELPDTARFCPKCGAHAALVPACQETPADPATPPSAPKPAAKRPVQGVVFAIVAAVIALIACVVLFALRQNKDARTAGETDPAQTQSLSTVSPSPSPSLSPMERKYSDFDPQATQLEFALLDSEGTPLDREGAEQALAEHAYGTWYWEDTDIPFIIDETTIDGRTYYVHAVKVVPNEGVGALITYADEPEMEYRLITYAGTSPIIHAVEISSTNDGPDGYTSVWYEYSQTELDRIYAEESGEYVDYAEPEPTPPPADEYFYTSWYTVTIPGSWKDKYVWEENYGGYGDSFVHAVTFYSREEYESGNGGMLFGITLMNDIDREYEEYMEDSYTLGTLSDVSMMDEGRPSYYFADVVITTPSDGYDYAGTHPEYRELYNGIDAVVNSLVPADGYALF